MRQAPQATGVSWAEAMLERLRLHVENEGTILDSYAKLLETTSEDYVKYLLRLVLEDEQRHHQIFEEMANSLASDISWKNVGPRTPALTATAEPSRALLEQMVDHMLAAERTDEQELKRLAKDVGQFHGTLFGLLLRTMQMDTKKHLLVLSFVRDALRRAP